VIQTKSDARKKMKKVEERDYEQLRNRYKQTIKSKKGGEKKRSSTQPVHRGQGKRKIIEKEVLI